jgi:hypothetical protein
MVAIPSAAALLLAFRFRSRASLELKLIALQHQLAVLRRQRPGRPQLSDVDANSQGPSAPVRFCGIYEFAMDRWPS